MSGVAFFSVWGDTRPFPKMGNGMNKVLPGLYIGNIRDSKDEKQLTENGITHILSIHDNAEPVVPNKEYLCIHISDTPDQNLSQHFHKCIAFIHDARSKGGSVLVHCLAGVSRSVTVSVAYIASVTDHDWMVCLDAVRQSRTVANPNYGFQKQLHAFQQSGLEEEKRHVRQIAPVNKEDHEFIANLYEEHKKASAQFHYEATRLPGSNKSESDRTSGSYAASSTPLNRQSHHFN